MSIPIQKKKEITETLNWKSCIHQKKKKKKKKKKKMTLMTAYYFVYKMVLSIETNLDVSDIVSFLDNGLVETENGYNKKKN